MNFSKLARELGIGEEAFLELTGLLIETSLADLERLRHAMDKGSAREVREAAHSIKGAASSLGFEEMALTAREIEVKASKNDLDVRAMVSLLEQHCERVSRAMSSA